MTSEEEYKQNSEIEKECLLSRDKLNRLIRNRKYVKRMRQDEIEIGG